MPAIIDPRRFVGETELVPEHRFRLDQLEHAGVKSLLRDGGGGGGFGGRGAATAGSSSVVWVGAGSGVVDARINGEMRRAIVADRAERQQAAKLGSVKPYSRHGFAEV